MKKVIEFLKWPGAYPAIGLGILYAIWFVFGPMALGDETFVSFLQGIILFAIYLVLIVLMKASSNHSKFARVLLFISSPISIGVAILFFIIFPLFLILALLHDLQPSSMLIAGIFLFIIYLARIGWKFSGRNGIVRRLLFIALLPLLGVNLLYFSISYPITQAWVLFRGYRYYIISELDYPTNELSVFYKCRFLCSNLMETDDISGYGTFAVDQAKGEVNLLDNFGGLIYTDGKNPRIYIPGAVQFQRHIYQLSVKCPVPSDDLNYNPRYYYDCATQIITIYKCRLDYTGCDSLPMEYTSTEDPSKDTLEPNAKTDEIRFYDGSNPPLLIYTYGPHQRCYVDGCTITSEQK